MFTTGLIPPESRRANARFFTVSVLAREKREPSAITEAVNQIVQTCSSVFTDELDPVD